MKSLKRIIGLLPILFLSPVAFAEQEQMKSPSSYDAPSKLPESTQVELQKAEVSPEEIEKTAEELKIRLNEKVVYVFAAQTSDDKALEAYRQLTAEEQEKFHEVREYTLRKAASVLSYTKLAIGFGQLVGNSITYVRNVVTRKELEITKTQTKETIQSLLTALDKQIWEQSHLFVRAGDMGVVLVAGLIGEGGVASKGWGGILDIGISIGYDRTTRTLVFEIFKTKEKFKTALPSMMILGLYGKAGFYVSEPHAKTRIRNSSTFYPPAFPGYAQSGADYFSAGASTGLGFPPPGWADLLSYVNDSERATLFRLRVSPELKGFVRLQIGLVPKFMKQAIYEVEKSIHKYKMQHREYAPRCTDIL